VYKKMSLSKLVSLLSWAYSQEQTRTICAYIDYLVDCIRKHPDSIIQRRLVQYVWFRSMPDATLYDAQVDAYYQDHQGVLLEGGYAY